MVNGLILFLGESFRYGGQGSQNRGSKESYEEQITAFNSHIDFIEHIITKFNLNSVSVFISSYNTQYDKEMLQIYDKYLIGYKLHSELIGIHNLFLNAINEINDIDKYDFFIYIRIDLFLKELFFDIFNPNLKTITFPCPNWYADRKIGNNPRINPILIFIPKKYYKYIPIICSIDGVTWHDLWHILVNTTDLTIDDLDFMINTYHGACSSIDFQPLYYITNRPQATSSHHIFNNSQGAIFDKYNFN